MNTKEAIQAMLDGKKVRSVIWSNNEFCFFDKNAMEFMFNTSDSQIIEFDLTGYGSGDFEIYKEPKQKEVVTIEKWLCLDTGTKSYCICEESCVDAYINDDRQYLKKVKLLDTYEETL